MGIDTSPGQPKHIHTHEYYRQRDIEKEERSRNTDTSGTPACTLGSHMLAELLVFRSALEFPLHRVRQIPCCCALFPLTLPIFAHFYKFSPLFFPFQYYW